MKRLFWLLAVAVCPAAAPVIAAGEEVAVVGRITEIAGGELLRYDPDAGEWVALVPDSPFGIDDALYTDERARAEILIPNGTLVRLDDYTQILCLSLQERLTHIQLSDGRVQVVSRANGADIEVQTAFGRLRLAAGAAADIAVDGQQATVTAVDGIVEALAQNGDRYTVQTGDSLSLADGRVASVATVPPSAWTDWNRSRDRIWAARNGSAESSRRLPAPLAPYAYELDAYGEWRRVYYSGAYHWLWHPTRVVVGWSPFSHGRWVTWYGDPCWIPAEPFGYVTHHYGSWEFLGGLWFWVPPNPGIGISLRHGWYPGRVGWVSYGGFIGWYPLLWNEPWYARRHWGPYSYPYARYRHGRHHHAPRAVVVAYDQFHRSRSYASARYGHFEAHRFQPTRGPYELAPLRQDRRRFYAKGTPAVRVPAPSVTRGVRQRIESKRHHPALFGPTVGEKPGAPPRRATIGGPRSDPRPRVEGRSMERSPRMTPPEQPDRLHRPATPSGHPERLHPPSGPDIRRHGVSPPAASRQMKPLPPPPARLGGKSPDRPRTAPRVIEKPPRRSPSQPRAVRERPVVSPQPRQVEPAPPVIQWRHENAERQPRQRMERAGTLLRQQAVSSQRQPRIHPPPARPRMQNPAASSASRQRPAPSMARQPTAPSGSGRRERPSVQAPQRGVMKAPAESSPPPQRPLLPSRPGQMVSPRPQPEEQPVISTQSPQQRQRPTVSSRHHGGRSPYRGGDILRPGRTP